MNKEVIASYWPYRAYRKLKRDFVVFKERKQLDRLEAELSPTINHVSGPKLVKAGKNDVVVVCLVRDGEIYIDEFLEHYRSLGVRHFVFLDNGSSDGGVERLANHSDVTVLQTLASYKQFKFVMKRYLVRNYGQGNWVLCVDIDELFDFPMRNGRAISHFLEYLNGRKYTAVVAQMLDMFPKGKIISDTVWRNSHVYYNNDGLRRVPYDRRLPDNNKLEFDSVEIFHGGVRNAKFSIQPILSKHPLVFPNGKLDFFHHHFVRNAHVADVSGVLYHYKFVGDYQSRFSTAISTGQYFNNSEEYKGYVKRMEQDGGLDLSDDNSKRLTRTDQLLAEDFIVCSRSYVEAMMPVENAA